MYAFGFFCLPWGLDLGGPWPLFCNALDCGGLTWAQVTTQLSGRLCPNFAVFTNLHLASAMEPSAAEIQSFGLESSIMAIALWAGWDQTEAGHYFDLMGFDANPAIHPRLLCMLSQDQHQDLVKNWCIEGVKVKPVMLMTAGLVYKISRLMCGVVETAPPPPQAIVATAPPPPPAFVETAPPPPQAPAGSSRDWEVLPPQHLHQDHVPGPSSILGAAPVTAFPGNQAAPANGGVFTNDGWYGPMPPPANAVISQIVKAAPRTIKASALIDPQDESVIYAASTNQVAEWYQNYKNLKFGDPLIEKEPSDDQICALSTRIIDLKAAPYADFSLLTPFGRRMQKTLRHRSWIPQQDGSYQPIEVPGPADWETWKACWDVYEVILLMLRWPAANAQAVGAMVASPISLEAYLQNFHTLVKESPGCWHLCAAAEDRCRAEHFPRIARQLTTTHGYAPSWSDVFVAAANDNNYWDTHVRRPALRFIATRGSHSAAPHSEVDVPRQPKPRATKKEKFHKPKGGGRGGGKGRGKGQNKEKGDHPRKSADGKMFITTREGEQICFGFARGKPCEKTPCSRVHVCQFCMQSHANASCPKRG